VVVATSLAAVSLQHEPPALEAPSVQQSPAGQLVSVLEQQSSGRLALDSQVPLSHGALTLTNEASAVSQQLVAFEQHEPEAIEQEGSCELIPI